jgi:hypothetical protein
MAEQISPQHIHTSISKLLSETSKQLSIFLQNLLPSLFED